MTPDAHHQGGPAPPNGVTGTQLRHMFTRSPAGQAVVASDGTLIAVNEAYGNLIGYAPAELIGRSVMDLLDPPSRERARAQAAELRGGGATASGIKGHYRHRDGHLIPIHAFSTLVEDPDGGPPLLSAVVIDVSAEERLLAEQRRIAAENIALTARLHLLHTVATAANEAETLAELAPDVIRAVCEHFGWETGALATWTDGTIQLGHQRGTTSIDTSALRPEASSTIRDGTRISVIPIDDAATTATALVFSGPAPVGEDDPMSLLHLIGNECARVTERSRARAAMQQRHDRFASLFNRSPMPIGIVDAQTFHYIAVNAALCELLGYHRDELLGRPATDVLHHAEQTTEESASEAALASADGQHRREMLLRHASGRLIAVQATVTWMNGPDGSRQIVAHLEDLTARREAEERLRLHAETDDLTGLANRFHLMRVLDALGGDTSDITMLFMNLDGFKLINDTRGRDIGDAVLVDIAGRLAEVVDESDLITRFAGDEFAILMRSAALGGESPAEAAHRVVAAIESALAAPVVTATGPIHVTASIGIAVGGGEVPTALDLLQRADAAMNRAKTLGRDRQVVYNEAIHQMTAEYRRTESLVRTALDEDRFVVFYQPIVELASGRIHGFEALVRMFDRSGRIVVPGSFISVAETSGLIVPMGTWVLREACRRIAALNTATGGNYRISVNMAARQAARTDLVSTVVDAVSDVGLASDRLSIELTESALLEADDATLAGLYELRTRGVTIALDDFGTGYSSLTYLRRFPVTHIKVDRSFVRGMTTNTSNAAIVRAVTTLANELGLDWVAEGIETHAEWQAAQRLGRGYGQGFLFSRPIPDGRLDQLAALAALPATDSAAMPGL